MGGCTDCHSKPGCDSRKTDMMSDVERALAAVYPTRRWAEPIALEKPFQINQLQELADFLAQSLNAACWVRHIQQTDDESSDELCDFVYVLCVGREPCLGHVRDLHAPIPDEWQMGDVIQEQVLRIAISRLVPMCVVQQVALVGERTEEGITITESPRAGVYDGVFLKRMRTLVTILPEFGLLHVDFGEVTNPPEGFDGEEFSNMFGEPAALVNYLFLSRPANMQERILKQLDNVH